MKELLLPVVYNPLILAWCDKFTWAVYHPDSLMPSRDLANLNTCRWATKNTLRNCFCVVVFFFCQQSRWISVWQTSHSWIHLAPKERNCQTNEGKVKRFGLNNLDQAHIGRPAVGQYCQHYRRRGRHRAVKGVDRREHHTSRYSFTSMSWSYRCKTVLWYICLQTYVFILSCIGLGDKTIYIAIELFLNGNMRRHLQGVDKIQLSVFPTDITKPMMKKIVFLKALSKSSVEV